MKKRNSIDDNLFGKSSTTEISAAENLSRREFLGAAAGALAAAEFHRAEAQVSDKNKMSKTQTKIDIEFLREYPTTLLESAISLLQNGSHDGIRLTRGGLLAPRTSAAAKRIVGYAATSQFSTDPDDERGRKENMDYWTYVFNQSAPKIAVSVDASREAARGSSWGQLNGHIHRALGCRGVLTNGGVRDIGEFERLNFAVFSGSLTVGHGNPHFIRFGEPVTLYDALVNSGDAVVADEHGAIVVPAEMLPNIREAVAEIQRRVSTVAAYCQSKDFTPQGLADATKRMKPAAPWKPGK